MVAGSLATLRGHLWRAVYCLGLQGAAKLVGCLGVELAQSSPPDQFPPGWFPEQPGLFPNNLVAAVVILAVLTRQAASMGVLPGARSLALVLSDMV